MQGRLVPLLTDGALMPAHQTARYPLSHPSFRRMRRAPRAPCGRLAPASINGDFRAEAMAAWCRPCLGIERASKRIRRA